MKKLIFTLPFLALAVFLAYCTKSDVKEGISPVDANQQASSRGKCAVTIYPYAFTALTYCGTQSNTLTCGNSLVCPVSSDGVTVVSGDHVLNLKTPATFSVSSDFGDSILVVTNTNQYGPIWVPAGGCQSIIVDDDCTVHQ